MLTISERRARALELIASRKARGLSLSNKITQAALNELAHLDEDRTIVYEPGQHRCQAFAEHQAGRHFNLQDAGVTIGGEFVPIAQPTSADDHDANLGWAEPTKTEEEIESSAQDDAFEEVSEVLSKLVIWLNEGQNLEAIGTRAVALSCLINPSLHEASGKTRGTQAVAARKHGLTRAGIQKYCRQVKDLTHGLYQARCQRGAEVSVVRRAAATEQHRRAGHKVKDS